MKSSAFLSLILCLILIEPIRPQDSEPAFSIDNATTLKFRIYKLAVSTSAQCTSPTVVFESATGIQADLLNKPTFGKGKIPSGTYPCIMVEVSKNVSATSGAGTCSTPTNSVICADASQSRLIDGTVVNCSGGTANDQRVVFYFTTLSGTNTGTRVLLPPTGPADNTSGVSISNPGLVFPTNRKAAFKMKKQVIRNNDCSVDAPTYSLTLE